MRLPLHPDLHYVQVDSVHCHSAQILADSCLTPPLAGSYQMLTVAESRWMLLAAAVSWTVSAVLLTQTVAGCCLMLLDAVLSWDLKAVALTGAAPTMFGAVYTQSVSGAHLRKGATRF